MPLFQVQDADRPMYVVAENFTKALEAWTKSIAEENDITLAEAKAEPPLGINYVCDNHDLIICLLPPG